MSAANQVAQQKLQKQTILGYRLPNTYRYIGQFGTDGKMYSRRSDQMKVIETWASHKVEGQSQWQEWHHVSCSFPDHLPSYEDLKEIKAIFVGAALTALQIFPPADRHISIHDYALHLWTCLDGPVTPDFGKDGSI